MHARSTSTTSPAAKKAKLPLLPRLPVPDLRGTLDKYLASLEPILLEDEKRGGMSYQSGYTLRKKWADEFEQGIGKVLQDRLIALDKASPNNWLDDNFWIDKAYMEWREPLLVNSNWWLAFFEDDTVPAGNLKGETNNNRAGTTFWQLRRAAWLTWRILEFKDKIDRQEVHPDTTRTGLWFRNSTAKLFNIARIPEALCDTLSNPPETPTKEARSLLVMLHDWAYAVPVYHPPIGLELPVLISPREIEARLRSVVLDVEERLAKGEKAFPIGVLSADNRDKWAANLKHLFSVSPVNRKSHQAMLNTVMGLSLDHTTYVIPSPASNLFPQSKVHHRTAEQNALDSHLHTIRGTPLNVSNRFFDKAFTLIVDPSTRAGASGEHSPCDALVPSIVAEYGIVQGIEIDEFAKPIAPASASSSTEPAWERLDWVADDKIAKECISARARADRIMDDSDDSVLWFNEYGTDWIKAVAKLSPDAYIQMALQLAWYKTRGEFTATYETVLTRMFKNGRTETLRTLTRDSREWVLSMIDPSTSNQNRYRALQRAVQTHTKLTREAATGRGIDRHLLGLQLLLRPPSGESAALFEDELFSRSTQWKLSTSGLSAGHLFKGTGFGASYADGYGINYLAAPNIIKFGIESKFTSPVTSTETFKSAVVESLREIQLISISACIDSNPISSHL
ncbi:acyltransferase ChoActase/COT/CPT [Coprinopsis marcescibilis]|uniref:Acyltransferase ChoActase/COT/CPT n=1 Tax=Coprinopsis marcescibilis TaxID=230819 RepID=A0A5C3KMU0_COPMA|nr:acyltransferase ChoActase/COT/CPT [Coprinopsis marcescibilis]